MIAKKSHLCRWALYLLCFEIIAASLFFGAVHKWAWSALVLLSHFALLLACAGDSLPRDFPFSRRLTLGAAAVFAALSLQLLLPLTFVPRISPAIANALEAWGLSNSFPALIYPYLARLALYQWLIPLFAFFTTAYVLHCRRHLYILLGVVVATAVFQGGYGIAQFITASDPIPFLNIPYKQARAFRVTGSYITYNTYACFLGMATMIAFGLLLHMLFRRRISPQASTADKVRHYLLGNPRLSWIVALFSAIVIMTVAVFLSMSRGGMLSTLFGIAVLVLLWHRYQLLPTQFSSWVVAAVFVPTLFYIAVIGITPAWEIFMHIPGHAQGRWQLWRIAWTIFRRHFWLGCGGGSFPYAFEVHMPAELADKMTPLLYAHNDYLHFAAEYGIISFSAMGIFFILWFRETVDNFQQHRTVCPPLIWCAVVASLGVVFAHAVVDFSLHIPGHRLLCAVLMGGLAAQKRASFLPKEI